MGRTARAERAGKSITLVTQYDVDTIQRIEAVVGKKMELLPVEAEEVALLRKPVNEASRVATSELREQTKKGDGRKRRREGGGGKDELDRDGDVVEAGVPKRQSKKRH